ncbi:hypothetical protein AXW83_20275 [Bosea sp. PAMC 26642]|nr:hypothetical protein AXW83_20275 [Bosea sp. PAMC 26642]
MASMSARCPDDDHQPVNSKAVGQKAVFAIILAVIDHRQHGAGEHLRRILEIETAFLQRRFALGRMVRDLHTGSG